MEREWEIDRVKLYELRRANPKWTQQQLAKEMKRSISWVKKWLKRIREERKISLEVFKRGSPVSRKKPREIVRAIQDAVLSFRDQLNERYGRRVGAKTILYHLHRDRVLQGLNIYIPKSPTTIWKILKMGGRIPTQVREHHPLERPEPLQHFEMDFGQLGKTKQIEFLSVVDRGTSILVDTQSDSGYNAEKSLLAVAKVLMGVGLPRLLRFDNDTRFVGSWLSDGYPSPLMRFLWCLGVVPDVVEPGKPQHKPYVERSIRTLKHECLWLQPPENALEADQNLEVYRYFYNHDRPHQGDACNNLPPYIAFPHLPQLPTLPQQVDPDAWLGHYHRRIFKRRVGQNGMISVGTHSYYVDYKLAQQPLAVRLDAEKRLFYLIHQTQVIRQVEIQGLIGHSMNFQDFLKHMLAEARRLDT